MREEHVEPLLPNDAIGSPADATSTASDPCGCLARPDREPSPAPETDEPAAVQPERGASPENAPDIRLPKTPRRPLKLVLHLQPSGPAGYRALLALGGVPPGPGCDPFLRAAEVTDLAAALDEIPGLLAEAEARWQSEPRNPAAPKAGLPPGRATTPSSAKATQPTSVASGANEPAAAASVTKPTAEPTPKSASSGQLSLFD